MRFRRRRRRRSATWWGVFFWALLLVGVYIFFDILDIDGPQITRRLGHQALIVVETPDGVAERFFRADLATIHAPDLIASSLSRPSLTGFHEVSPAQMCLRLRQNRIRPRLNLSAELTRRSPSASDPA